MRESPTYTHLIACRFTTNPHFKKLNIQIQISHSKHEFTKTSKHSSLYRKTSKELTTKVKKSTSQTQEKLTEKNNKRETKPRGDSYRKK